MSLKQQLVASGLDAARSDKPKRNRGKWANRPYCEAAMEILRQEPGTSVATIVQGWVDSGVIAEDDLHRVRQAVYNYKRQQESA